MPATNRADLAFCCVVSMLLLGIVWAEPGPVDDLFIALAGGRDVMAGRLGAPDDWSFTTEGRPWLNQNWASHVLLYATHTAAGPGGLLVLKGLLLALGTWGLAVAARARAADWPTALVIAAAAFAAGRSYIDLRPSLVGLVLTSAVLAALARAPTRAAWLWVAALLVGVWANAHGSFLLGLGLLALFTVTVGLGTPGLLPSALGATAVAVGLAAFANPFGLVNLTHPFVVGTSPAWRTVAEWVPLFRTDVTTLGSRWEICAAVAAFVVLRLAHLVAGRRTPADDGAERRPPRGLAVFDVILVVVTVIMAVRARRFVPIALVALAAPLASDVAWWVRRFGSAWPVRAVAAALAVGVLVAAPPLARRYAPDNPVFGTLSTFETMIDAPTVPIAASEFLRTNGIRGRAYAAWEAEGYLRWTETPVTVLIGGRAQQVYDEPILGLHKALRTGAAPAVDVMKTYQVALAILPLTAPYALPLGQLLYTEGSPWVYLYCDGRHVVLADTSHPDLASTMAAFEAGTLRYPTPAIAATSRMMYQASPKAAVDIETIRTTAEEAARLAPTALAYAVIGDVAMADRSSSATTRQYLAEERERLAQLAATEGETLAVAQARLSVARVEHVLIGRTVDPEGVQRARHALDERVAAMRTLLTTWAYGWDPNVF